MKKAVPLIIVFLLFTSFTLALAEYKTFTKEYNYQASEYDSKVTCRTLAFEQVKRLLLEQLGTYLESNTEVKNFNLTKDEIIILTAGVVSAELIDERWDGKTYLLKAKLVADPQEVSRSIDSLRQDRQKNKDLEEIRKKAEEALKEVERLRKELETVKADKKSPGQYTESVNRLAATDWLNKGWSLVWSLASKAGAGIEQKGYAVDYDKIKSQSPVFNKAIEAYNKAIELDPTLAKAYHMRGACYLVLKDYGHAIKDYNKAIELGLNDALAYYSRGVVYDMLGDEGQAIRNYDKAIELDPQFPQSYYLRGSANLIRKDYKQAINDLTKAIELNPEYANAYYNRADAYHSLGNYNMAIKDCNKTVEFQPKNASAYHLRGSAYRNLGNYGQALRDYDQAIELNWNEGSFYYGRGLVYKKLGDVTKAKTDLIAAQILGFEPEMTVLVCTVGKERKMSFKLNFSTEMVNGIPATFTDSEITWLYPVFPEDWKTDGSGKKKVETVWVHIFNKRSGSLNIGNVLSGQCQQGQEKTQ